MRHALLSLLLLGCASSALANDWLTLPSTFSHGADGRRVAQYAQIQPPVAPVAPNFRTSGYTHTRSSLNYGQSSDNYHRVEEWGDNVRPYGEWRFPFRPYGTPYPNWGPPFAGFNQGFGFPAYGVAGVGQGFGRFRGGYGGHGHKGKGSGDSDPDHGPHPDYLPRYPKYDERGFLGGGRWPTERGRNDGKILPPQPNGFSPYPSGPGTPYPVAPYYDGYYPSYRE